MRLHAHWVPLLLLSLASNLSCNGSTRVEARWSSSDRGKYLINRGHATYSLRLPDGLLRRIPFPDSIDPVTAIHEGPQLPKYDSSQDTVIFVSEKPFVGVWAIDEQSGDISLISAWDPASCAMTRNTPSLTPSGDTVLGSTTLVKRREVSVDYAIQSRELYFLRLYVLEGWYPGCECAQSAFPMESRIEERALKYITGQSPGAWSEIVRSTGNHESVVELSKVLPQGHASIPSSGRHRLEVTPDGSHVAIMIQNRPRVVSVYNCRNRIECVPTTPANYPALAEEMSFSPNGNALAVIASGRGHAVLVCRAPKFDRFELVAIPREFRIGGLQWTRDGDWILVSAREGFAAGEEYLLAIEVSSGELLKVAIPPFGE